MSRPIKVVTISRVSPITKTTIEVTRTQTCSNVLNRKKKLFYIHRRKYSSEGYEKDTRLSVTYIYVTYISVTYIYIYIYSCMMVEL